MCSSEIAIDSIALYAPTWDAPSQMSKRPPARYWAQRGHRVVYVEVSFHLFSLVSHSEEVRCLWQRYMGGP